METLEFLPPVTATDPDSLAGFSAIATKFGYLCGALGVPPDLAPRLFTAGVRRMFLDELTADQRRAVLAAAARAFAPPPVPPPTAISTSAPHVTPTASVDATSA